MPVINSIWFYLVLIVVLLAILVALIAFGFGRASKEDGRIRDVSVGVPRKPSTSERSSESQQERPDAYSGAGLRQDTDHDPA